MNGKTLTQGERDEAATKGWIEDQNYVNTTTFKEAIDVLVNLIERQGQRFEELLLREKEEFRRYIESLHENHVSLVSGMGEVYDFRIEKVEKRVDALEQRI